MSSDPEMQRALREIFERLGGIDAKLAAGSKRHDEFASEIKDVREKIEPLPMLCQTLAAIKPIVDDYKESRTKFAGIMLAVTTLAGGIGFFASELKAFFLGRP